MGEIQARYPDAHLVGMPLDALFGAAPEEVWETCDALVWSMATMKRDPVRCPRAKTATSGGLGRGLPKHGAAVVA